MSDAIRSIGTVLTFTEAVAPSGIVGELTSIGGIGGSRDTVDVTNYDSEDGMREFISGLGDAGEVAIEGNYVPADLGQDYLKAAYDDGEIEAVAITFSDSSTVTFDCLVSKYEVSPGEVGGKVSFSSSLKISGKPVWA